MSIRNRKKQKGFTLVELSIVLVIIGLIVSGVLVGQDLIQAARIRAQMQQFTELNTAMNTFRSKYDGLPGDLRNGIALGLQTGNGNGDGIIDGTAATASTVGAPQEAAEVFAAMSSAGMVAGQYNNQELAFSSMEKGGIAVAGVGGVNYYVLGAELDADDEATGDTIDSGTLTGFEAWSLDSKLDDGFPTTGSLLAMQNNSSTIYGQANLAAFVATPNATNCVNATPTPDEWFVSETAGSTPVCPIAFRVQG